MLTVAKAQSRRAWNIFFWTAGCYQMAGRGFSASWRADSPVCRLINLIIESSCSTLIWAWWVSWEDSLSTVTSLYDFFRDFGIDHIMDMILFCYDMAISRIASWHKQEEEESHATMDMIRTKTRALCSRFVITLFTHSMTVDSGFCWRHTSTEYASTLVSITIVTSK